MVPRYQNRIELLQGTLDLLILQTLQWGPHHGYGISQAIRASSGEILQVDTAIIDLGFGYGHPDLGALSRACIRSRAAPRRRSPATSLPTTARTPLR